MPISTRRISFVALGWQMNPAASFSSLAFLPQKMAGRDALQSARSYRQTLRTDTALEFWTIDSLAFADGSPVESAFMSDGRAVVGVKRGGEKKPSSVRLIVPNLGFLDIIEDIVEFPDRLRAGTMKIYLNNKPTPIYEKETFLSIKLAPASVGTALFEVSLSLSSTVQGMLLAEPSISDRDIKTIDEMMSKILIPYPKIPDAPGQTPEQIKALGRQYFPYTSFSSELANVVYDWTTADFSRVQFINFFMYTGVEGTPMNLAEISSAIWKSDWETYTPQNKTYMNSFLMEPANSFDSVCDQLACVSETLQKYAETELRVLKAAAYSLPRTPTSLVPALYSGQVDIYNLGSEHFAVYFEEFPNNRGPVGTPLQQRLADALDTFIRPGATLTTKSVISFTDSPSEAKEYSNGIFLTVFPPPGIAAWPCPAFVSQLSDDPMTKNEYIFVAGDKFEVLSVEYGVSGTTEIKMQVVE